MNKKVRISLYILVAIIQILVISSTIFSNFIVSKKGTLLKIKVLPVDPYDPFRGKYLVLDIETSVTKDRDVNIAPDQKVYVSFKTNSEGFSEFDTVSLTKPDTSVYVRSSNNLYAQTDKSKTRIENPFSKFYIKEKYSLEAERVYREKAQNSEVYITVRVLNGKGVIEDIYIEDQTIIEFIEANR